MQEEYTGRQVTITPALRRLGDRLGLDVAHTAAS